MASTPKVNGTAASTSSSDEPILIVEHVKWRNSPVANNGGRSPVGKLIVFRERVEWKDDATDQTLVVPFQKLIRQRVSAPTKTKIQLQLNLKADEGSAETEQSAIFMFCNPKKDKEGLTAERDLAKDAIQQALLEHREYCNRLAAESERDPKQEERTTKARLLRESKQLELLYLHLVKSGVLGADDFWTNHFRPAGDEALATGDERLGVSGGFLSGLVHSDGTNGIRLSLNAAVIEAIFQTYPIVKRKHLELVPHVMTKEDFWAKFFQSHYFHREREVIPSSEDPFAECTKDDEADMAKLAENSALKRRRLRLDALHDDTLKEVEEEARAGPSAKTEGKSLLLRRCNYLSERIIAAQLDKKRSNTGDRGYSALIKKTNGVGPSTSKVAENGTAPAEDEDLEDPADWLESAELGGGVAGQNSGNFPLHELKISSGTSSSISGGLAAEATRKYSPEEAARYAEEGRRQARMLASIDLADLTDEFLEGSSTAYNSDGFNGKSGHPDQVLLDEKGRHELKMVQLGLAELLRHFWQVLPPLTPQMEEKLARMEVTLASYEQKQLHEAARNCGETAVASLRRQLELARSRLSAWRTQQQAASGANSPLSAVRSPMPRPASTPQLPNLTKRK